MHSMAICFKSGFNAGKTGKSKSRELAIKIIAALPQHDVVMKVELAGPGFINFFINPNSSIRLSVNPYRGNLV